jgi:F-type H+-transporting ATPase subunit epsilon
MTMRLRVLLPTEVLLDAEVAKVRAEAANGCFCLLPRHVDFVAALVPSILSYTTADGQEKYVGIDTGTLVKRGDDVLVSVFNAVHGVELDRLSASVRESFRQLDEDERQARGALARLEAGALRRFYELERSRHA